MGAETAFPGASKFKTFIFLRQLVFELELFKPPIEIWVFGLETHITGPIVPKIFTKSDTYVSHLSSKFQVSTFSRFEVIAFSTSGCRIRNFAQKKHRDFRRKASRKSPQKIRKK